MSPATLHALVWVFIWTMGVLCLITCIPPIAEQSRRRKAAAATPATSTRR